FSVPQKIMINDQSILLTPRQFEIICILILNPLGLTLEQLHIYLYGDEQISLNTLKSEISYLKNKVGELICARTYQIQAEIHADFKELEDAVDAGYLDTVKQLYQGDFFIKTKSPFLNNWQQILSMRINNLLV
ncbi:MAG: helix-turn-helix domain-containing protein, partial [Acinetobacter sp.]|nr:helix-turn-helix domain-containing protein [Acinetobacter sp.]MDN5490879.1 helix-turn-helix domain-containing protein [Acinetobacter sp.]MDN5692133.1 helix-turn-helix domain-containing protein [Acinetobacter sp.]